MRILMVSEDVPYENMGGLAKHALNLSASLIACGHDVDFLGGDQFPISVAGDDGNFGGRFFGELRGHRAGWKESKLGFFNPYKRTWIAKKFASVIAKRAVGYDVVHYHGHVPNLALYLPKSLPFIQTRHDQGSDCLTHTRFRNGEICTSIDSADCASCIARLPNKWQQALSTIAVKRYRAEVAASFLARPPVFVSAMLKENFARSSGVGPIGIVVHNFTSPDLLGTANCGPLRSPDAALTEVIVVGKLYPPKGIDRFIELFAKCNPKDCSLLILGDGPQLETLRSKFASERIRFLGWCTNSVALRYTAGADVVVVPSIWEEPCATTILEGLGLGKTTFALNRGGTPELSIYERRPGQLKLFDDLEGMVANLNRYVPFDPLSDLVGEYKASVQNAVTRLIPIYDSVRANEDGRCNVAQD